MTAAKITIETDRPDRDNPGLIEHTISTDGREIGRIYGDEPAAGLGWSAFPAGGEMEVFGDYQSAFNFLTSIVAVKFD